MNCVNFDEPSAYNACNNQKANHFFFFIWMKWFFLSPSFGWLHYIFQINNMVIFIYIIIMNNNDWTACIQFLFFDMTDKILFCSFNLSNIYLDIYLVGHNLDLEPILGLYLSISFYVDFFFVKYCRWARVSIRMFLIYICTYFNGKK